MHILQLQLKGSPTSTGQVCSKHFFGSTTKIEYPLFSTIAFKNVSPKGAHTQRTVATTHAPTYPAYPAVSCNFRLLRASIVYGWQEDVWVNIDPFYCCPGVMMNTQACWDRRRRGYWQVSGNGWDTLYGYSASTVTFKVTPCANPGTGTGGVPWGP